MSVFRSGNLLRATFSAILSCGAAGGASGQDMSRADYATRLPAAVFSVLETTPEYRTLRGLYRDQRRRDTDAGIHSVRADRLLASLDRLRVAAASATVSKNPAQGQDAVNFAFDGQIIMLGWLVTSGDERHLQWVAPVVSRSIIESAIDAGAVPFDLPPVAQQAFDSGVAEANGRNYLAAVRYFEEALKLAPRAPTLFFNLGLAESNIPGREMRAAVWLGAFLQADPQTTKAAAIRQQSKDLIDRSVTRLIEITETVARQVSDEGLRDAHLATIAGFWARAGNYGAAFQTIESIRSSSEAGAGLAEIAAAQAAAGDVAGALQTAERIQVSPYLDRNSVALLHVSDAQLAGGDIKGAMKTVSGIRDSFLKANALQRIGDAQAETGNPTSARQTLVDALVLSDSIPEGEAHLRQLIQQKVAVSQAKMGDMATALRTAKSISVAFNASLAESAIAELLAKSADSTAVQTTLDAALATANEIQEAFSKSLAMEAYTEAKARIDRGSPGDPADRSTIARPLSISLPYWLLLSDSVANMPFFVNLGAYLTGLPSTDSSAIYESLKEMVGKALDTRETAIRMLAQQAAEAAAR